MKFIETYKCNECNQEFGISIATFKTPSCPLCGEGTDVEETTDNKKKSTPNP